MWKVRLRQIKIETKKRYWNVAEKRTRDFSAKVRYGEKEKQIRFGERGRARTYTSPER